LSRTGKFSIPISRGDQKWAMQNLTKKWKTLVTIAVAVLAIRILFFAAIALIAEHKINQFLTNQNQTIQISKIRLSLLHPKFGFGKVQLSGESGPLLEISDLKLDLESWTDVIKLAQKNPETLRLRFHLGKVKLQARLLPPDAQKAIRYMGFEAIEGSTAFDITIRFKENLVAIQSLKLHFRELFDLEASLNLKELDLQTLMNSQNDPEKIKLAIQKLTVDKLVLHYLDLSLMARAMTLETYPEFAPKKEPKAPKDKEPVFVSAETNKKISLFFQDFMISPTVLTVKQEPENQLAVFEIKDKYLSKRSEVTNLVKSLGISVFTERFVLF
jgi:hypothetical protein